MTRPSPITPTVDFDRDGIQHGYLRLPHSRDESAWGSIMIPITVAKNGDGPTVVLTGGNHGDEYEGPIALMALTASIDPAELSGRVIVVPMMNYPAVCVGTRTSPIDRGNLNRTFPGRPDGTVTEKIADFFQRSLLPMADFVLDIHSGGKTLDFIPFAAIHELPNAEHQARCLAAMDAFNAPYQLVLRELDAVGMYDSAAEEMGKVFVSTELRGGGSARPDAVAVARRGITNFLRHAGVLAGPVDRQPSMSLSMPSDDCYIMSERSGLFETCIELGERVAAGDIVARVYDIQRTGQKPTEYRSAVDGILAGRHFPGLIQGGDAVAVIAVPDS